MHVLQAYLHMFLICAQCLLSVRKVHLVPSRRNCKELDRENKAVSTCKATQLSRPLLLHTIIIIHYCYIQSPCAASGYVWSSSSIQQHVPLEQISNGTHTLFKVSL